MTAAIANGTRTQQSRGQTLVFALALLGLLFIVCSYMTFYYGRVTGEEFSPDDFHRRSFSYYRLPLVNLQISPITRTSSTNALEQFLETEKLIPAAKVNESTKRWDLVVAESGIPTAQKVLSQGEARILCLYLDAKRDGKHLWLEWTEKNRELAKILWPEVAQLARQELYLFIPELLVAARGATDPANFKKQVATSLADQYLALATAQQQLGNHEHAVELFAEGLKHAPDRSEFYSSRAKSLEQLGQKDRAASDLAEAKKRSKTP